MNFIKNYWWVFLLLALAAFAYWYFEKKTPNVVAGDTKAPGKLQIPGLGDDLVIAPTSGTGVVGDEMA